MARRGSGFGDKLADSGHRLVGLGQVGKERPRMEHHRGLHEAGVDPGGAGQAVARDRARRCHIAQSGLSASTQALEADLGVQLFARTTRRVTLALVSAGQARSEAGQALLSEIDSNIAVRPVREAPSPRHGRSAVPRL